MDLDFSTPQPLESPRPILYGREATREYGASSLSGRYSTNDHARYKRKIPTGPDRSKRGSKIKSVCPHRRVQDVIGLIDTVYAGPFSLGDRGMNRKTATRGQLRYAGKGDGEMTSDGSTKRRFVRRGFATM